MDVVLSRRSSALVQLPFHAQFPGRISHGIQTFHLSSAHRQHFLDNFEGVVQSLSRG